MKRCDAHTTSKLVLTEKLPGTSVDAFPNGCVFVRDGEADPPSAHQQLGARLRMDEQLKEEKWRQRGGEG